MKSFSTCLDQLIQTLAQHTCAILQAPPGIGKTTRVPLALISAAWLGGKKILMLEPRRLAARSAARYMASLLGEEVGGTVGFRVRLESRIGARTRIEVVTEGVLTRLLQDDPSLDGYGLVIFDEFHERSLQADLGLVLCREVQQALRPDLRLLIMSATLQREWLAQWLGGAPSLVAQGRQFPVVVRYAPPLAGRDPLVHMAATIQQTLKSEPGSILVFLPGAGEIRRVAALLQVPEDVLIAPLYGDLPPAEQDQAIQPAPAGQRKVVLATNIAETSLTIEGVRIVIDSGLARQPLFDPGSSLTRLLTQPISQASAEQRKGRAGRLEPGICLRLWPESETAHRLPDTVPEILVADLAPLVLELALWGTRDASELAWPDPPPPGPYAQARALLRTMGALDRENGLTPHGRQLARLPLHPRLGHMVLAGQAHQLGGLACTLAALISERDPLPNEREADIGLRLQALQGRLPIPPGHRQAIQRAAAQIADRLGLKPAYEPRDQAGFLLGLAYPDRLARRRPGPEARYLMAGGQGAVLAAQDSLAQEPWLAIAHLDGRARDARIFLAAALDEDQVETLTASQAEWGEDVTLDAAGIILVKKVKRFGALVLAEQRIARPDAATLVRALLAGIRQSGLERLPWSQEQGQLRARVEFLRRHQGESWPAMDSEALTAELEAWLAPFLAGINRLDAITATILQQALEYRLGYQRLPQLEAQAPTHWTVPSGSRVRLDYTASPEPVLAVRLQEMFGAGETPRILNGTVPVLLHLLSPARRPVQVTRDLPSFWRETYPEIKKELKGRYPRHYWPDDPLQAEAVRGIKQGNRPRAPN